MVYQCLLWFLLSLHTADAVYSATAESAIRTLTVGAASYDAVSRPAATTNVKVALSILAIDELDLKNQKFTVAGWLTFEWTDSRLTWTPGANDDIESIFVTQDTIWKPELLIDNSLANLGVISDSNLDLRVSYNGVVEWEPPHLFTTHCQVDISYYPYDRQKCGIEVVSWGYTIDEVTLEKLLAEINLDDFQLNGEWIVSETLVTQRNISDTSTRGVSRTHSKLVFWLYLVRRQEFYNINVMIPIVITSLLVMLVFIVPVDSGEKLSYALTVFLSLAVLLTLVADALPSTSISTSVLGVYLAFVLILSGVACLLTVIVLILFHKKGSPGSSFAKMFVRVISKVTCTKQEPQQSSRPSSATSNKVIPADDVDCDNICNDDVIKQITWTNVSIILDKFFFIVFSIVTVAVNISCIIALAVGGLTNSRD